MSDTPRTDDVVMQAVAQGMRLAPVAELARELESENAALREERDSYRLRAEQNWGLRKEIQSALNVPSDCEGEEALKQGLAAIKTLRADKERLDWLSTESGSKWAHHESEQCNITRRAIDAAMKEVKP